MAASTASGKKSAAATKERCDALSEVLADSWWMVGLRGILGIVFGLICLFTTDVGDVVDPAVLGLMFVDGCFAIAAGIRKARGMASAGACCCSKASSISPPESLPSSGRRSPSWC